MKLPLLLCAFLASLPLSLSAQSLRNAGILGNSGEQGPSLVRFSDKQTQGMGVVYDRFGTLWDRAGDGKLNRYAQDGRLLASWTIPLRKPTHLADSTVLIGDTLLFNQERKLYTFSINSAPGAAPVLLPIEVTQLSPSAVDGWAAAARDGEVFLVNLAGETKPVGKVTDRLFDVEIKPDGAVYVRTLVNDKQRMTRLDSAAPENERGPWNPPGNRPQWLNGFWFGSDGHGTIRRFDADFKPSPGVVLGGNSGSFIGYVPGNYELQSGRGLAHLGGPLYAASGLYGVMHLLEWVQKDNRFEIVRRIGSVPAVAALAIDRQGRVWYNGGMWEWADGPDVPLRHGVPPPPAPGIIGAGFLDGDLMVALGKGTYAFGKLDGPVNRRTVVESPAVKAATIAALVERQKKPVMLALDKTGRGAIFGVVGNGQLRETAEDFTLQPATAFKEITSLAPGADGALFAAADGQVVEFAPEGSAWRETRRWNSWGALADTRFGARISVATGKGRIWVSDTERHRVLCFDQASRRLLGVFGTADRAGDDLATLNRPETIAVNEARAVVFDSGNQRLVRLELETR